MADESIQEDELLGKIARLQNEELHFLASLTRRACQAVIQPQEITKLRTASRRNPPSAVRVACLSFDVPFPRGSISKGTSHQPSRISRYLGTPSYDYVEVDEDGCESIFEQVKEYLETCSTKPHFVLLNELSLCFSDRDRISDRWKMLAKDHGIYLLPGTFHCSKTYFNVAPIYTPSPDKYHEIAKHNTALRAGENIRTPDAKKFHILPTDFGNLLIWICLDMYDPGLVLKFLNITHRFATASKRPNEGVHLVLIPSYNSDARDNIKDCARQLSYFSKTAIVCANSFRGEDSDSPRREAFGYVVGQPMRAITQRDTDAYHAALFEFDVPELSRLQGASFLEDGINSSPFSSIVRGGRFSIREIPQ